MIPALQIEQAAFPAVGGGGGSSTTFDPARHTPNCSLSGGNLVVTCTDSAMQPAAHSVNAATANHYCEITWTSNVAGGYAMIGLVQDTNTMISGSFPGSNAGSYGVEHDGDTYKLGVHGYSGGVTYAVGQTVKIWLNAGSLYFAKTGSAFGTAFATGLTGNWAPCAGQNQGYSFNKVLTANFGASAYIDTPPSGAANF